MTVYALQRLLGLVPVLFGISVVIFLTMKLIPGDVARALLGPMATDQSLAQLRHALGLDEAIHVQYAKWLWRALHGDLGLSPIVHKPVMDLLLRFEILHAPLRLGEIAARVARVRHRERRARTSSLVDIPAAVQVRLRKDVRLGRPFFSLGIDQNDLDARLGRSGKQPLGQLEMHREGDAVDDDGRANRDREHAIVTDGDPTPIHVHSYVSRTTLS